MQISVNLINSNFKLKIKGETPAAVQHSSANKMFNAVIQICLSFSFGILYSVHIFLIY